MASCRERMNGDDEGSSSVYVQCLCILLDDMMERAHELEEV